VYTSLSAGAIGIRASLPEQIELAKKVGFQGLDFSIQEATSLAQRKGIDHVRGLFSSAGIKPGCWGLPVNFRKDDESWQEGLAALPGQVEVAVALDCLRTATWIMPFSDELTHDENLTFHADRLRPVAEILEAAGIRLGLEYVGPLTLRAGHAHEFIHDLAGWRELAFTIGTGNIGLLLDAYHWYVSHGTVEDLDALTNQDVVLVHMNDGIAGVPADAQLDQVRCLPGESGVIDLDTFLRELVKMAYDGPVVVEPFSERLKALPPQEAAAETLASLKASMAKAGMD
jgi:sugar phosphate isomerase/epimerase